MSGIRKEYENDGNPRISIDTKKKEKIGNLYRDWQVECVETTFVYDHDFPHLAEGKTRSTTCKIMKRLFMLERVAIPVTLFAMRSKRGGMHGVSVTTLMPPQFSV